MTQPKFAPIAKADEVRPISSLGPTPRWRTHRPSERDPQPSVAGRGVGIPGPDQGYALLLAEHLAPRLVLAPGEHKDEMLTAAVVIGLRRAALFGRAPVLADLEVAAGLFGCFSQAPSELVALRQRLFSGISHDYRAQRELAQLVPDALLRYRPEEIKADAFAWRSIDSAVSST